MQLTITQAKHKAAISAIVEDAVSANAPAGDCARATDAAVVTAMRGGRTAAMVPTMGAAAGAAAAK